MKSLWDPLLNDGRNESKNPTQTLGMVGDVACASLRATREVRGPQKEDEAPAHSPKWHHDSGL